MHHEYYVLVEKCDMMERPMCHSIYDKQIFTVLKTHGKIEEILCTKGRELCWGQL